MSAPCLAMLFRISAVTGLLVFCPAAAQEGLPTPDTTPDAANAGGPVADQREVIDPEVQAAIVKGVELVEAKDFKEAIAAFQSAVRRYPAHGQFRHLLGLAYIQDKQLGPAWLELRKAVRLQPGYAPAADDFLTLWETFDQKGVLGIGRAKQEIARLMGEPDDRRGEEAEETWEYGFMRLQFRQGRLFAIIDPRGLDAAKVKPLAVLDIAFDDKNRWRLGYRAINHIQSVTEYVPKTETVQQWTELYTVQRFYALAGKRTPQQMMRSIEENLKQAIPGVDFVVLSDREGDVLFHWRDQGDKSRPPQHEIVRLVAGQRDVHRLAYARRVKQIPVADAKQWVRLIQAAKLVAPAKPSAG